MPTTPPPGTVLGVSLGGRHYCHGTGRLGAGDSSQLDSTTIYDLASLTKVIGLTTATMLAVDEGRLALDSAVVRYVPAFRQPVTLRQLLTHSSGLPAWRPLYRETNGRADALAAVDTTTLDTLPGTRFVYSDLGAMILTQAVESAYGTRVDSLLARRIFAPLRLRDTRYLPPTGWQSRFAPTEDDPWRGHLLLGEVHDENAARLGGVSGHAGLFSSGRDLLRFADWLLRSTGTPACARDIGPVPGPRGTASTIRRFTTRQDLPLGSSRALGWDTPSEGSSAGRLLSPASFGHTGFTGTSLWIDPARCLAIVPLSNRVHPTSANNRWGPVRAQVADRVAALLSDSWFTP